MSDLFSPGDHRAGSLMTDRALVDALIRVEWAWHAVLVEAGIAPGVAVPETPLPDVDLHTLAEASEAGGNPVIPLVSLLRTLDPAYGSNWLHRGLTSQDVLDTAFILLLRDVLDAVVVELGRQIRALRSLADQHRATVCVGRTLTQHAVPTTFGLIAASWLDALLDVATDLDTIWHELAVQVGGAAGTLAAIDQLAPGQAVALAAELASQLRLRPARPWHTQRRPITRIGDGLVAACDAWGRIANDVLLRTRPEIGELREGSANSRGGSSTMPHKQNPVLSVLIRRTALDAPHLGAALHTAAAAAVDQRPDGGWHAEWVPSRTLARQAAVAANQATELLEHIAVDAEVMRTTAQANRDNLLAEARSIAGATGAQAPTELTDYLGAADQLIDATLAHAADVVEGLRR